MWGERKREKKNKTQFLNKGHLCYQIKPIPLVKKCNYFSNQLSGGICEVYRGGEGDWGTGVSFGALSPLGRVQTGALPELGKANNPGVNLVLPWEANGTRAENRREEAKQPASDLKSIPCHTPFLVGAS